MILEKRNLQTTKFREKHEGIGILVYIRGL